MQVRRIGHFRGDLCPKNSDFMWCQWNYKSLKIRLMCLLSRAQNRICKKWTTNIKFFFPCFKSRRTPVGLTWKLSCWPVNIFLCLFKLKTSYKILKITSGVWILELLMGNYKTPLMHNAYKWCSLLKKFNHVYHFWSHLEVAPILSMTQNCLSRFIH